MFYLRPGETGEVTHIRPAWVLLRNLAKLMGHEATALGESVPLALADADGNDICHLKTAINRAII
jgi:hypothetical protein